MAAVIEQERSPSLGDLLLNIYCNSPRINLQILERS